MMEGILRYRKSNTVTFSSEFVLHLIRKSGFSLINRAVVNGQNRSRYCNISAFDDTKFA